MTEDEAQAQVTCVHGGAARDRVANFLDEVVAETTSQNLISPGTIPQIWVRHALDSAQLVALAPPGWRTWLDVGTGGGFPGMIVALLEPDRRVVMAEPRRRRAEFLQRCVDAAGLKHAQVVAARAESVAVAADVISARAVASVENILSAAGHCASFNTVWLLPRGRSGLSDAGSRMELFHVEQSLTDAESVILVGKGRIQ